MRLCGKLGPQKLNFDVSLYIMVPVWAGAGFDLSLDANNHCCTSISGNEGQLFFLFYTMWSFTYRLSHVFMLRGGLLCYQVISDSKDVGPLSHKLMLYFTTKHLNTQHRASSGQNRWLLYAGPEGIIKIRSPFHAVTDWIYCPEAPGSP